MKEEGEDHLGSLLFHQLDIGNCCELLESGRNVTDYEGIRRARSFTTKAYSSCGLELIELSVYETISVPGDP